MPRPVCRSHWKGKLSGDELLAAASKVDADVWRLQRDAGIDLVALDGTLYDQACSHLSNLRPVRSLIAMAVISTQSTPRPAVKTH